MADSRDKPELETLSYRNKECPAKPSSTPMGFNSVVVKPETRVNKIESAEQALTNQNNVCRHCGACRIVRPTGEWQFTCRCYEDDTLYPPLDNYKPPKCVLPDENGGVLANPEQPNQNLMIIEEIEGLMSQVNEKVENSLRIGGNNKKEKIVLLSQAVEEIDLFQKTTLFELRKAFE